MDTRLKIITAAIEVFSEKGKHGARMEEIAARAAVNKAMLYYFFSSRENLYAEALSYILRSISQQIVERIETAFPTIPAHEDKIRFIVKTHFEVYSGNPAYTKLLMKGMSTDPGDFNVALQRAQAAAEGTGFGRMKGDKFVEFFEDGVRRGIFRDTPAKQVLISIVGMNLIYFIAQPIAKVILNLTVEDEEKFISDRQASIIDLLLYGIMEKRARP